jgi:hypothetical protein
LAPMTANSIRQPIERRAADAHSGKTRITL